MSKEFTDLVKQEVKERIRDHVGQEHYICDFGFLLTEYENCNGSWFCSTYEAKEFVKKYFDDFEDYQGWYRCNFGEPEWFESEPDDYHHDIESVQCRMMIYAVEECFNNAFDIAFENDKDNIWNSKIEITQDFCDKIEKALEEVEEIW